MGKRRLNLAFLLCDLTSKLTTKKGEKLDLYHEYTQTVHWLVRETCFQLMLDISAVDIIQRLICSTSFYLDSPWACSVQ